MLKLQLDTHVRK